MEKIGLAIDFGHWLGIGYNSYVRINHDTSSENIKKLLKEY